MTKETAEMLNALRQPVRPSLVYLPGVHNPNHPMRHGKKRATKGGK